ncbi:MAG: hypothetical protein VW870_07550, partial [Rhodobiaceae bacterium]
MRRGLIEWMRVIARLGIAGGILAGCTTAELAIDMVKKSQKEKQVARQAEELTAGTVVAKPRYKVGDPYNVGGVWYYPSRDLAYDETGIGSW